MYQTNGTLGALSPLLRRAAATARAARVVTGAGVSPPAPRVAPTRAPAFQSGPRVRTVKASKAARNAADAASAAESEAKAAAARQLTAAAAAETAKINQAAAIAAAKAEAERARIQQESEIALARQVAAAQTQTQAAVQSASVASPSAPIPTTYQAAPTETTPGGLTGNAPLLIGAAVLALFLFSRK